MNGNYRAAIAEGSKSLTPGMADDIKNALQAQRLAIKQADAKEEINRINKLQTEVEVQEKIAGIVIPETSSYSDVDVANQMKGLVATHTSDLNAIKQGTATKEQVRRSVAFKGYVKNMGDTFGTFSYTVDEFIKIKNDKGTDGKIEGSIDLSSLDPRFNELINIQDPNSTAKGQVSLDVNYKNGKFQTYQVVKSEVIREENRRLYEAETNPELQKQYLDESGEISDMYKLSYEEIQRVVNNKNGNTYLVGNQFGTVPGVSSVVANAKANDVIKKDGSPAAEYMSQVPFQKTITQNGRRVVVDVIRPEVNKIAGALKAESNALTRLMFGGGENSAYASFAKANFDKFKGSTIDKDGNVMVPLLKRNEAGEYELDDSGNFIPEDSPTEIGSNSLSGGRFNMRTGVGNENLGMTKEDFDKANRFTQDVAIMNLNLNGASREKINQTATNAINTPPTLSDTEKTQLFKKNLIDDNLNAAIEASVKDPSQVTLAGLNNLKTGYSFEINNDALPNEITVYSKETAKGGDASVIMEIDLGTEKGKKKARQNLYSEFGVDFIVDQEELRFEKDAKEKFEKNQPILEITSELEYRLRQKNKDKNFIVGEEEEDVTKMLNEIKLDDGRTLFSALKDKGIEIQEANYSAGEGYNYLDIMKDGEKVGKEINLAETGGWRNKLLDTITEALLMPSKPKTGGSEKEKVEISNLSKGL